MDAAAVVKLVLSASILLLVFALGLQASFADATSLLRNLLRSPHRLLRALVAMYVVVPAAAVGLAWIFELPPALRAGLLAVAIAPIPPILPGKQLKFGGDRGYVFGLLVAVSLSSIGVIPLMVLWLDLIYGRDTTFGPGSVLRVVGLSVLLPLAAGLVTRHCWPRLAERMAPWVSRIGTIVLVASLVPMLIGAWPAMVPLWGQGALLASVALAVVAVAAGHLLGGSEPSARATLAIASAMRHPGVALALVASNAIEESRGVAVVLLYLIVGTVLTTLYGLWRSRRDASAPGAAG
jgi:BASS family bile acid:Na+ symporter